MPRKARIDAPGALHHIIVRGIERRKIFWDDEDQDAFVNRLGQVLINTRTDQSAKIGEKILREKGIELHNEHYPLLSKNGFRMK